MDAFIVSSYVKNSLKKQKNKKNLEHAAFLINPEAASQDIKVSDKSMNDNSINNNSINDNSINDNTVMDNSLSETEFSPVDNSSNITVNNIKVTNIKKQVKSNLPMQIDEYDDEDDEEDYEDNNNNKANNISTITFLLMLIINSYAAYLSWECNSGKDYPLVLKVVFSFFAFTFGSLYLLYYILFRFDECNKF